MKHQLCKKVLIGAVSAFAIAAVFNFSAGVEKTEAAETFSDVSSDFWASGSIQRLAEDAVINGYSDGTFQPGQEIKRGQVAELLTTAFNLDTSENPDSTFNDLSDDSYFTPYAEAVQEAGYITGRNNNTEFAAGMDLSREQMATILVRAFELERIDEEDAIVSDINQAAESHQDNIEILAQHGVTQTEDGVFRPKDTVSRAQFAVFLERAMATAHTRDSGLMRVQAYDRNTVDVSFNREIGAISVDDFSFDPSLVVYSAEFIEPEESYDSNSEAETVVRLKTAEQHVQGYRFYYQGERTDNVIVGADE
ncbi:S-layer homology domain-containing protein [Salibacterium salarium]|uniref:S-layer homology domain-containing protein n=1 Tax=Salibacterium salarium TaxID=284579 RepID=A0A3R9P671_9BACI|nr:S-layer homology domain-containing protein [Salibacterium salarium]RSL32109.1 S-layer homology domain-containing protein [Salibacterium salarium]